VSYGRITLLKRFCPTCHSYAIVVENKLGCCGRTVGDWAGEFMIKHKRECETPGLRVQLSPRNKRKILSFQGHQCVYCGCRIGCKGVAVEFDHFVSYAFTGDNGPLNMVASCRECNQMKSSRLFSSIEEARVYILNEREKRGMKWSEYYGGGYEVSRI
jgi:hypothetical protein